MNFYSETVSALAFVHFLHTVSPPPPNNDSDRGEALLDPLASPLRVRDEYVEVTSAVRV